MINNFKRIADLISQVGPKLDQAERLDDDHVYIETKPMVSANGVPIARVWGPFADDEAAHNYVNVKRDRHRISNAAHFGAGGPGTIENDKHLLGHPQLEYRIISGTGYYAKYLAQIMMECCGALVEGAARTDTMEWVAPSEEYGITDEDEGDV